MKGRWTEEWNNENVGDNYPYSACGPNIKLADLSWLGLDLVLSVAWSFGVQLVVFFCSGISKGEGLKPVKCV